MINYIQSVLIVPDHFFLICKVLTNESNANLFANCRVQLELMQSYSKKTYPASFWRFIIRSI